MEPTCSGIGGIGSIGERGVGRLGTDVTVGLLGAGRLTFIGNIVQGYCCY